MTPATIVETKALLQTIAAAAIAGIGITVVFSIAVYGVTRFADFSRDERGGAATLAALAGILAFAICIAAAVVGVVVMAHR